MEGRKNSGSNTLWFSDEEIKNLAESTTFTEEKLRKLSETNQFQYTKEELIRLVECAYIPTQKKPVHLDQEHDVIYFAAEEDKLTVPESVGSQKNYESPEKQSSSSSNQICNVLRTSYFVILMYHRIVMKS